MTVSKRPRITGMPNGRPKREIDRDTLVALFNQYHCWELVAENLNVSTRTIYRRLKEYNLEKRYTWM